MCTGGWALRLFAFWTHSVVSFWRPIKPRLHVNSAAFMARFSARFSLKRAPHNRLGKKPNAFMESSAPTKTAVITSPPCRSPRTHNWKRGRAHHTNPPKTLKSSPRVFIRHQTPTDRPVRQWKPYLLVTEGVACCCPSLFESQQHHIGSKSRFGEETAERRRERERDTRTSLFF